MIAWAAVSLPSYTASAAEKPGLAAQLLKELQAHIRAGLGEQAYAELERGEVRAGRPPGGGGPKRRPPPNN